MSYEFFSTVKSPYSKLFKGIFLGGFVKSSKASVTFIFVTILLDAIGLGLLIPVLPDVIRRFTSSPQIVSEYFGYFMGSYAAMQFIASPILGTISDRFGRKPILLCSLLGAGLDYIFMAFAPSLSLLFLGRVISGLTGASMTVASSYMADISDDTNRSTNFGMIGAAWGLGFVAGPLLGGLLGAVSPMAPFMAAAALNIANFLFGVFILPESLPPEKRRKAKINFLNPLSPVLKILRPSEISTLVWIYFFLFLAGQVHPVNWTLYVQTKFQWTAWEVGISLSFIGIVIAFSQGFLTRWIIPKIGERKSLTLGILVYCIAFGLFGVATQGWMMYAILLFFGLSGVAIPALQSIMARHVPANAQGELQGSLVSLGSLSAVLAPLIYTQLFMNFTIPERYFPGVAYVTASVICLLTFIVWIQSLAFKKNF